MPVGVLVALCLMALYCVLLLLISLAIRYERRHYKPEQQPEPPKLEDSDWLWLDSVGYPSSQAEWIKARQATLDFERDREVSGIKAAEFAENLSALADRNSRRITYQPVSNQVGLTYVGPPIYRKDETEPIGWYAR